MNKKIIGLFFLTLFLFFVKTAYAAPDDSPKAQSQQEVSGKKLDKRAKILAKYFEQFNSPLQNYSQDFIDMADKYQLDWKWVVAIAGVESTFGKFIPGGTQPEFSSYNAWGWGASTPEAAIHFKSWKEGIETVTKGLKENYFNKGLTDPYSINKVYAASSTWGSKVDHFIKDIDAFSVKYEAENPEATEVKVETSTQTAAVSGQLATK